MNCIVCNIEHERRGIYCSKKCGDKAYRDRKRVIVVDAVAKPKESINRSKKVSILKEKRAKSKWCNYCGKSIEDTDRLKFCSDEHSQNFLDAIDSGKSLRIKIDHRTTIITDKYNKIQEIIEKRQESKFNF